MVKGIFKADWLETAKNPKPMFWRVYDRANGSFPFRTKELGEVAQEHETQALAESEANRLNDKFPVTTAAPKKKATPVTASARRVSKAKEAREKALADVEDTETEELADQEIKDYGDVLSETESAAYTEGIFEKTVY